MVVLSVRLLGYVKKPTYLPNPLAAAGLVRGPAAVRDIVPRTILNSKVSGPRPLAPGWKMIYNSVLLGTKLRLRVRFGSDAKEKDGRSGLSSPDNPTSSTRQEETQTAAKETANFHETYGDISDI
ncbi:hypothetical protein GBAR_LOCUS18764 [Geodia barretti]|uniref:Uncharacterized protein n=1 Tax=Geodia barretti TaxID=519541 RepID=A0AA35SR95_GEOBA|nr:hypothetical protein GBAR_LOCUS18764 [Geodia barretti]